jgi:hypothetical protein
MMRDVASVCGVTGNLGPHGEPISCGYAPGHDADHSWATLPTFVEGRTVLERAAIEFVSAERAWADVAATSGRMTDPKRPEDERRLDAHSDLIAAVDEAMT